ncbi:hypothetical protein [Raineyella fluvialis]|uniref:Uncharacterized protein n=1 Tax=Raineyella fluvialis TaxID=2662261 RepID=A0A5Q2FHN9_9ACTN|nr:hypothetical protein [Raineyella fluvialis]QGF24175.1 hypothetical protein Rai3103_11385 [Raineyella fluvialis]
MIERRLRGWSHGREDRPAGWSVLPQPGPRPEARGSVVGPWALRASTFPRPSSGSSATRPAAASPGSPAGPASPARRTTPGTTGEESAATTGTNPHVVPLGGGLALVSVGRWDEESSTTIQMPAIRDEPAASPGSATPAPDDPGRH